jgi:hypothetical protein
MLLSALVFIALRVLQVAVTPRALRVIRVESTSSRKELP